MQAESVTCPRCGLASYNPNDVLNKYCGACHAYHPEKEKEVLRKKYGFDKINSGWAKNIGLAVIRGKCVCGDPKCEWSCSVGAHRQMGS